MVEQALIQALHQKRFRDECARLRQSNRLKPADLQFLDQVEQALAEFDESVARATAELVSAIGGEPGGFRSGTRPTRVDGKVTLAVNRESVDQAADALAAHGYSRTYTLSAGAEIAHRKVSRNVSMVAPGGPITSVSMRWGDRPGGSLLARYLRPSTEDLSFIPLPARLWPLYWLVRPFRLIAHLFGWRRREPTGPFLGTPVGLIPALLDLVDLSNDSLLVDLGCGDGRVLIEAARITGCRTRGIEANDTLVAKAMERVEAEGLPGRVEVTLGDLMNHPVADARVVFAFLPASQLRPLVPLLLPKMAPGSILLAHEQEHVVFDMPPHMSRLIVSPDGITVAHLWHV